MIAMSIKSKKSSSMFRLLENREVRLPKVGDLVEGPIIARKRSSVFIDLGPMGTGMIFGKEFYNASDILKKANIGDKIAAKVVAIDEEEGYIELSAKEAGEEMVWDKLKKYKESGESLTLIVNGANKGGLLLKVDGIGGFLPASQLSLEHYPRVEGGDKEQILRELQKLVGKPIEVKVLDVDPREQKLIFSEKSLESEILRNIISKFNVGEIVEGEISGIVDFGAFFRIAPEEIANRLKEDKEIKESETPPPVIEGLIHISELDWKLIENPSEVVKVGDKVRAKIIDISQDGRISFSLKALKEDPWKELSSKFKKGDLIRGEVVKFNPYGAFVKVSPYVQGLVHVSELGSLKAMQDMFEIGKEYEFKILLIDPDEHRMALGLPTRAEQNTQTTPGGMQERTARQTETQSAHTNFIENSGENPNKTPATRTDGQSANIESTDGEEKQKDK